MIRPSAPTLARLVLVLAICGSPGSLPASTQNATDPAPALGDTADAQAQQDSLQLRDSQLWSDLAEWTASPTEQARLSSIEQLLAVYRRIPGLRDIELTLEGRILEIQGRALSQQDRDEALRYASELVPDLVFIDSQGLAVETDVRKRFEPTYERMREKGLDFLRFLPSLLLGLAIVVLGGFVAGWVGRRGFLNQRFAGNPFARNLVRQGVRAAIVLLALLLALDLMGVGALVGAVLGAAGVAGIAIGFAFRDIIENYLAGILLSVRQPFSLNDHVLLAGEEGRIARLTGRETVLMTLDGNHVRIPNATVFKAVMTNFTRNPRRRFSFDVEVPVSEPVPFVRGLCSQAVGGIPGVLGVPSMAVLTRGFTPQVTTLRISGWVDQTATDFDKTRSQAVESVKAALDANGISSPPHQLTVELSRVPQGDSPRSLTEQNRAPDLAAPRTELDSAPDTTIEDEIARELTVSDEENLLQPPHERRTAVDRPRADPSGR